MRRHKKQVEEDDETKQPLKFSIGSDDEEDEEHQTTIPASVHLTTTPPPRRYVTIARWLLYLFPRILLLMLIAATIYVLLPGGWRVALCTASILPPPSPQPWQNITLIAHRGCEFPYPENTLQALKEGSDALHYVEIDLALTADDHVVLMHDPTLDRTTNGTGITCEHPLAYIQNLRVERPEKDPTGRRAHAKFCEVKSTSGQVSSCTYRVPTLAQVFDALPDSTRYMLDVKACHVDGMQSPTAVCTNCTRLMERTRELMERNFIKPEHVVFTSTESAVLNVFQAGMPKGSLYSLSVDVKFSRYTVAQFMQLLDRGNFDSVAMHFTLASLRPDLVRAVLSSRADGTTRMRDVLAWTIRRHIDFRAARCAGVTNFIIAQPKLANRLTSWLEQPMDQDP